MTPTPPIPVRRARGWRSEPCPASLTVGIRFFDCQKLQTWKGHQPLEHHHRWDGVVDGYRTTMIWRERS